jgi:CelD/BcsL family acetyltransferase involved in cellulose biosynthesis
VAPLCDPDVTAADFDLRHRKAADRLKSALRRGAQVFKVEDRDQRRRLLDWILLRKEQRMAALGTPNVLGVREQQWLLTMALQHPQLCALWTLVRDGRPMAGFLTWVQPRTVYGYTLSFDPEFAHDSPGITLLYAVVREALAQGRQFDFLTGEQGFKLRFATRERRLFTLRMVGGESLKSAA